MNKTDKKELRKLLRGTGIISALTESGRKNHNFLTALNEDGSLNDEAQAWKQKKLNQGCTITNLDGSIESIKYEAQYPNVEEIKSFRDEYVWHEDGNRILVHKMHIKSYVESKTPDKPFERTLIKEIWRKYETQFPE